MFEEIEIIKKKYFNLKKKLEKEKKFFENIKFLKEFNTLEKIIYFYNDYIQLKEEKKKLEKMIEKISDKKDELFDLAIQEKNFLESKIELLNKKIRNLLFSKEKKENTNVIMEIKGAAGGNESNLFVSDLLKAYIKYAESQKWTTEIIHLNSGIKNSIVSVEIMFGGFNVYSFLKYESGIHRVQRIPITERKGRIHTSTVKILVIPHEPKIKLDLNWNDIRIDTFNASGPGGQSVNTTKSAVRLTHLPTKISVACQIAKSQHQNKEKAFQLLKNRIYYQINNEKNKERNNIKQKILGKGERSEKIRTYNYSRNTIVDHRFNLIFYKLDLFMEGKINLIIQPLINEFNKQKLKENLL
jgi:peptide chain release factor 1